MLQNSNLKICRRLMWREFRFHRPRNLLLLAAIALVCAMYTFAFALGGCVQDAMLYNYTLSYGSTSHILYYGLAEDQADRLADHAGVKSTVRLKAIGLLSDDVLEYRSVKLAAVTPDYAQSIEAVPTVGRLPQTASEIALDEMTLDSLGLPRVLGQPVTLRWTPAVGGAERTDTFTLCGYWMSAMCYSETCAWITPETAAALCPQLPDQVTLGVRLHQPDDLQKQAEALLADLGLGKVTFSTNLAYNDARRQQAAQRALPYYWVNCFVVLCGILMIYNIVHVSAQQDVRFYGRLKSLGMTPRQLRHLIFEQAAVLSLAAVPFGWLLGFAAYYWFTPLLVIGTNGRNPALLFFNVWPFVASAVLTGLTALAACWLPARFIARLSPAGAMRYVEGAGADKKRARRTRRISLFGMALSGLGRNKARTVLSAASLFLALLLLCGTFTKYVSYDEAKYLAGVSVSDYLLADGSAVSNSQRYNPVSQSISLRLVQTLSEHPAVTGLGVVQTMEQPMTASEAQWAPIVEYFEGVDAEGTVRREYMAGYPNWLEGYETFCRTGEYIGLITGVDGLALQMAVEEMPANAGVFDKKAFDTGRYVVAAGANSTDGLTTPPVGSVVTIGGREFEIMASVPYNSSLVTGGNSKKADFNVTYYLPGEVYRALFPTAGVRDLAINIDPAQQAGFEAFLREQLAGTSVSVGMRSDHQRSFQNARLGQFMVDFLVGFILLCIGVLNFGNSLASRMLMRQKEFAVYQSLGMTKKQLTRLMVAEGGCQAALLAALLVPGIAGLTWLWGRYWLATTNIWCVSYRFSLAPLWLTLPVLLALAAAVPLLCLRAIDRQSVTERLRILD